MRLISWNVNSRVAGLGDQSQALPGSTLTSAGTENFAEHLKLKKESDGWKIALEQSNLTFLKEARSYR